MKIITNILRKIDYLYSKDSDGYDVRDFRVGTIFGTLILIFIPLVNLIFPNTIPDAPVFRYIQICIQIISVVLSYHVIFFKKWGNEIGNFFSLLFAMLVATIAYNEHFRITPAVFAFMTTFIIMGMFKDKRMLKYYIIGAYSYFFLLLFLSDADPQLKTFFLSLVLPFLSVGYYVFSVKLDAVSDLEKREFALQQRETWFRSIFDNVPVGIVLLNQHYRPYRFNQYFQDLTGFGEGELINLGLEQIVHADDALYGDDYIAFMSGAVQSSIEQRLSTKDGKTIWMRVKLSQIKVENATHTIVMFNDITLEKNSENQLKESSQKLKAHNEALEEFSYVISHDLQEPLRMITSFSQIIQKRYIDNMNDPQAQKDFNFVIDGAKRMSFLIRDMLEYSRWAAKEVPVEKVETKLILSETLKNLTFAIEQSHAQIHIGNTPIINANKLVLGQIFQNLIGNAIRYAHPDRIPNIDINIQKRSSDILISVSDNGIGFEDKYKERIFGIFQRLHPDKSAGTGMGLAICKRIIEKQGGRIWAESKLNEGTTFYFTLPYKEVENTEGGINSNPVEKILEETL